MSRQRPTTPRRNHQQFDTTGGFRSGLERRVAKDLKTRGEAYEYEPVPGLPYEVPARRARYTPDFVLPNGVILEVKGRFLGKDRQKHLHIQRSRPELDIRFVFQRPSSKLYKGSKTTYAEWCDNHGFRWCKVNEIPEEWFSYDS